MTLSYKWLQSFTNIAVPPQEFAQVMTMSGSKVLRWTSENTSISNVVVGKVVSTKKLSDSEPLWICSVFVGSGIIQVLTDAQNVRVGDIVPVALDGATLANGQSVSRGKIAGLDSEGMMCTLEELGLTLNDFPENDETGIMKLSPGSRVGEDVSKVLGLDDILFELDITHNRPDCLCVTGLAREAAAAFNAVFSFPRPRVTKSQGHISTKLSVLNKTPKNCLRYIGAVVENVRVQPSPPWIRERLRRSGVQPVNNIIDITSYVMLEYNQPMHAFDFHQIKDACIIVRQAEPGEKIVTVDGVERLLTEDMMVVADAEKSIAIAGIIGSAASGITDRTKTIIFESACYNPANVRSTSKAFGLQTEASARFEKGLDPFNAEPAIIRALELIEQLDAGDIIKGVIDARGSFLPSRPIPLDPAAVNRFLGTDLSPQVMVSLLTKLECTVDENFNVTPPTFRRDLTGFVDLAEEIARLTGYDNIPSTNLSGAASGLLSDRQKFEQCIVSTCIAGGLVEINTTTFMGHRDLDMLGLGDAHPLRRAVEIGNPLSEDTSLMRTTSIPGMLNAVAHNYNLRIGRVKLFELAWEFKPSERPNESLPSEHRKLILGMYGYGDFYDIKGIVELIAERACVGPLSSEAVSDNPIFHTGRAVALSAGGRVFATTGEVMPTVVDAFGIHDRIYIADIDLDALFELRGGPVRYRPLPVYPAIIRDLTLVSDIDVPSSTIERAIVEGCGEILEELHVFDVHTGNVIPKGKKSIAYNLVLRDPAKALTDSVADDAILRALSILTSIGIQPRN